MSPCPDYEMEKTRIGGITSPQDGRGRYACLQNLRQVRQGPEKASCTRQVQGQGEKEVKRCTCGPHGRDAREQFETNRVRRRQRTGLRLRGKVGIALTIVVALSLFFVFVPAVQMKIFPCVTNPFGYGYASLSYRLFHVGETVSYGHFAWMTQNLPACF